MKGKYALLFLLLLSIGCSVRNVHYDHVTILSCGPGLDVREIDGTLKHYDVWNFSMLDCANIPLNVDVSLGLKYDNERTYYFGYLRKNEPPK